MLTRRRPCVRALRCAIDDRDLVLEEGAVVHGQNLFRAHFVLTEFHTGLTTALADQCITRIVGSKRLDVGHSPSSPVKPGMRLRPSLAPAASAPSSGYNPPRTAPPRSEQHAQPPVSEPTQPAISSVSELLVENDLGHLEKMLTGVTLRSMHETLVAPNSGGRVALLAQLRAIGIARVSERQTIANAFSKAQRQGRIGSPPAGEATTSSGSSIWAARDAGGNIRVGVGRGASNGHTDVQPSTPEGTPPGRAAEHLRGYAYASPAMAAAPGYDDAAGVAPPFVPVEERSVAINQNSGSRVRVASGLMAIQPDATHACIVTHPHPGRGGDMYNAFVGATVQALRHAGISTLRFNFSAADGNADDMHALLQTNCEELEAALHVLSSAAPRAAIVLLGYSWGAVVSLATARRDASRPEMSRVSGLALFAPPISMVPATLHPGRGDFARWPMLLAAGDADEYCALPRLRTLAGDSATTLVTLRGAGHFLHGAVAQQAAMQAVEWVSALASPMDMR